MEGLMEGDELVQHRAFHKKATEKLPEQRQVAEGYWVAVLPHVKDRFNCQPKDFLWFKVKGKHSVLKLQNAYFKRWNENHVPLLETEAKFCQGEHELPEATQMRHINHFNDDIIAFWTSTNGSSSQQNVSSPGARVPLQPLNTQVRSSDPANNASAIVKPEPIEPDPFYSTPYSRQQSVPPTRDSGSQFMQNPVRVKPEPNLSPSTPAPAYVQSADSSQGLGPQRPISAFMTYADEQREKVPTRYRNGSGLERVLEENWKHMNSAERAPYYTKYAQDHKSFLDFSDGNRASGASPANYHPATRQSARSIESFASGQGQDEQAASRGYGFVKQEAVGAGPESSPPFQAPPAQKPQQNTRLQKLMEEGSPEALEKEVKDTNEFLDTLKSHLTLPVGHELEDAKHWLQQIEILQQQVIETPTIIGVVGNTGAGKSSVINAMLDEERLVPTNCMRACTAVVTEMSWNSSEDPDAKYRADIEFIQPSEWKKDLEISLKELLDGNGNVSRDCTNAESEAGVAYAKIKAVYPQKTKEQLAGCSVEELMREPGVRHVLGTTKNVEKARAEPFYRALQHYVDSKEKSTGESKKKKDKEKKPPPTMEFWPLIKVVRIYTKADALSTGAVIVDLPGVHDSNAARAAVAAGYMKQCTGLWICAPINRAVDDKAAKSLLGESFKRQLKYDGTYSRVTFICSKTDDISITEASDSLGLEEEIAVDWAKVDAIENEQKALKNSIKELKETRGVYGEIINDADDALEIWEKLKDDAEDGKTVFEPSDKSKKRKHSLSFKKSRKKRKASDDDDDDDDFINDEDEDDSTASESESDNEPSQKGDPLTLEVIETKISELKDNKKKARRERVELDTKLKDLNSHLERLDKEKEDIEARMSAICIEGRNKYSKGAIQQDFAAGIKELDQENAEEEDAENFNPEEDLRDYDEVARSLPVFCVSSRAYQKLQGRLQRDTDVSGFRSVEETEIPQLQVHCKKLTEAGRAANCRRYLNSLSQLILSLSLWSQNDGTGINLSDEQKRAEGSYLHSRLANLEKSLDKAVQDCLGEMKDALSEEIFEHFDHVIQLAVDEAPKTSAKWGAPVNRVDRSQGGYFWATYKAICRREGVFSNAQGQHDFNNQLTEPIMKHLASHWEKAFARKLPQVLQGFSKKSKALLTTFHQEIENRSRNTGAGLAGLAMLAQQLRTHEATFIHLTAEIVETINNLQREANREFVPVVARNLASAYEWCAQETGAGQYNRMKKHMQDHVDSGRRTMFTESCQEVKTKLTMMCRQVEETIANKTDEVFVLMRRDYLTVVNGSKVPQGQVMPKWERQMRAEISNLIERREEGEEERKAGAEATSKDSAVDEEEEVQKESGDDLYNEDESEDPSKQLVGEASRTSEDDPFSEDVASTASKESADVAMMDRESPA